MAVVIASMLAKDMAGAPLLRDVSFKVERRERLTLAGRNGTGKTTLLRILAGESSLDGGELVLEKGTGVALHDQRPPRRRDLSLREYVLAGCGELVALEHELARLEGEMAGGTASAGVLDSYGRAQARLEHAGGYTWRERALATVRGLGFGDGDLPRALSTFSGGELTRASLARALACDPDLLLLDEPTNHLDIESLEWLEARLAALDAAVVLVAHDRWFLESVGTAVLELEGGRARFFPGTWHAWRAEKAQRELGLGRAVERQRVEIERLERFVTRFRAGTRARQAQARQKRLDRMRRIERSAGDGRSLAFSFGAAERSGRVVLELERGRLEVPGRTLLEDGDMWLERGEHVSLVGPNGAGKTTLVEALAGRRPLDGGKLRRGHNVTVGYLSQHAEELGGEGSVLQAAQRATGLPQNPVRALLGRFLFSGDDAEKPLEGLSGGERRRLSLAVLMASGANLLVLDEPTNHLDLESREALEEALRGFGGSVLLVSHDRALLDAVGSRTVELVDRRLRSYVGGWPEYMREREARRSDARASDGDAPGAERRARDGSSRGRAGPSKAALVRQGELEREVQEAEAALAALEDELSDPAHWADAGAAAESSARHAAAKRAVEDSYARWEAAVSRTL